MTATTHDTREHDALAREATKWTLRGQDAGHAALAREADVAARALRVADDHATAALHLDYARRLYYAGRNGRPVRNFWTGPPPSAITPGPQAW